MVRTMMSHNQRQHPPPPARSSLLSTASRNLQQQHLPQTSSRYAAAARYKEDSEEEEEEEVSEEETEAEWMWRQQQQQKSRPYLDGVKKKAANVFLYTGTGTGEKVADLLLSSTSHPPERPKPSLLRQSVGETQAIPTHHQERMRSTTTAATSTTLKPIKSIHMNFLVLFLLLLTLKFSSLLYYNFHVSPNNNIDSFQMMAAGMSQQSRHLSADEEEILNAALDKAKSYERLSTFRSSAASRKGARSPKRIAIVLGGTLHRFQLSSILKHFIVPLRKQNHQVDWYLLLTTAFAKAYRSDHGYMDHVHWDPIFSNNQVLQEPPSDALVEEIIKQTIESLGASVQKLILKDTVNIENEPYLQMHRQMALQQYPDEDPDTRFPLLDIRSGSIKQQTTTANQNILRLMYAIRYLWRSLLMTEKKQFQQQKTTKAAAGYDYVMFLRDDTSWLQDFDFNDLLQSPVQQSYYRHHPQLQQPVDAFALSCDARKNPMHPREMNDHGMVLTREKADILGNYYEILFQDGMLEGCANKLEQSFTNRGTRGCNSEMALKYIVESFQINMHFVGQAKLPFQRAVNVAFPNGTIVKCFHKYCQSKEDPLDNHGLQECKFLSKELKEQQALFDSYNLQQQQQDSFGGYNNNNMQQFQQGGQQFPFQQGGQQLPFQQGGQQLLFQQGGQQLPYQQQGQQLPFQQGQSPLFQQQGKQFQFQQGQSPPFQQQGRQFPYPQQGQSPPFQQQGGQSPPYHQQGFQQGGQQQLSYPQQQGGQWPAFKQQGG